MDPSSTTGANLHSRPMSELRSDYWMIQKLGVGGFAKVYLIKHRESKNHYACKHQKWVTQDTQRNARREAGILRRWVDLLVVVVAVAAAAAAVVFVSV